MFYRSMMLTLFAICLTGCGIQERFPLPYTQVVAPVVGAARPLVIVGPVSDGRTDGLADTAQFGTIRGGFGNPLYRMSAVAPISTVVAQALRDALAARGLLSGGDGMYELRGRVVEFDADKLIRVGAMAEIECVLVHRASGAAVWNGRGSSTLTEGGSFFATGVLADPEEIRGGMLRAMSAAIDQMLNRPDFVAALR